ncbi:hypothetical protein H2201_007737 [Coniosporium apollinis]|uniref:Anaphase-promoting complex subunit 4 WD40 domain-containing protein n=1 Tax=Coniosporium apollinis TaxID=61459 RepID=A0ABQ9NKJ9_9PEZI|nr:hypothetical protein H2201_007737 [Coniosporium apollinis]
MADQIHIFSSQELPSQHAPSEPFASSPLAPSSSTGSRKPKKPPPITPKRFTRFFTPRTSSSTRGGGTSTGKSGRQLRDITRNGRNGSAPSKLGTPRKTVSFADITSEDQENISTPKLGSKRKYNGLLPSPASSPMQPSPSKRGRSVSPLISQVPAIEDDEDELSVRGSSPGEALPEPTRIRRTKATGTAARILQRSFGGLSVRDRGGRYDHCADWHDQTSDFYSMPEDCHQFASPSLPFCTASCNTNTLVAIGDEDGSITLLESAKDGKPPFTQAHISFRTHSNAVMDLAFSSDDLLLATASGDQTAHVIDMQTQRTKYVMAGHMSSVKQVCFQPNNDNVIATSSRDGTVQLWDLRCKGSEGAIQDLRIPLEPGLSSRGISDQHKVTYATVYNTIAGAHTDRQPLGTSQNAANTTRDVSLKGENPARRGDVSITALSFLPAGRSHLLLTASEASTCVKLWDIRSRPSRRGPAVAVSTTKQPDSHSRHRHFGINSIALSGDGARLYALSRDSTVYAYSTNHLILGTAPEFSATSSRHRYGSESKEGLGPLYGFRHPKFHATSFYVKMSLRKPVGDKPEMLAVGSSDGCPVLFPTDETFLKLARSDPRDDDEDATPASTPPTHRPAPRRSTSGVASARINGTIPIYENGTALVRGHSREVTGSTWTAEGDLITISDDFTARCWREGPQARELRLGGEAEGRRWAAGWAEVGGGWDEEE